MFRDRQASDLRIAAALEAADGAAKPRKKHLLDGVDVPSSGYSHGAREPSAETIRAIAQRIGVGAPVDVAAAAAGISGGTLRTWIKKGEKGEEPFLSLLRECVRARAAFECDLLARMTAASAGVRDKKGKLVAKDYDMAATTWLLHRRCGYGVPEAERADEGNVERPPVRIVIEEAPNVPLEPGRDHEAVPPDGAADPGASGTQPR